MTSIIFTPKDIYEQDFKRAMRGYDPKEVDEFLDDVIKDYETYNAQIKYLNKEIEKLKLELESKPQASIGNSVLNGFPPVTPNIPSSIIPPEPSVQEFEKAVPSATNLEILKRISRLEKEVFGKQLVE